ncbi:MAG: hypothetical protein K2X44_00655, partial [Magnetospirillum sp.]|nr:hypothetical protein [Magnetospirillum sp.]
ITDPLPPTQLFAANELVMREIDGTLHKTMEFAGSPQILQQVVNLQNRAMMIRALQHDLMEFADLLALREKRQIDHRLIGHLVEAAHALVSMAPAAISEDADEDTLDMMKRLTGDRPDLMGHIRRSLAEDEDVSAAAQELLFSATMLFKRIIWQMRHLIQLLEPGTEGGNTSSQP